MIQDCTRDACPVAPLRSREAVSANPAWRRLLTALSLAAALASMPAAAQTITTVAGGGAGDGNPATAAMVQSPLAVAFDAAGNLFIADSGHHRVRRVSATTGVITTVAGNGTEGFSGDGAAAAAARLWTPAGVACDGAGNLFIADLGNHRIRRVDAITGVITTVAGNGTGAFSGDGGAATGASLFNPIGVALDGAGNLLIADSNNHRIRRVNAATGVITTVAGNGSPAFSGDGGAATGASLAGPRGVALDGAGNLFIADYDNSRIRRVDAATGVISTVAGVGNFTFFGDGGPATGASFNGPTGVSLDATGNLYIADSENDRVRRVNAATGVITTVAGNGMAAFSGDGGAATAASLAVPRGVALDGTGNLFIADSFNARIRRVDGGSGVITSVAGGGIASVGDGGVATNALLLNPRGVAYDRAGNLFIADSVVIRRVAAATGVITTVAGNGTSGFSGDGGPATGASMIDPRGIALDSAGNLFIAEFQGHRIRRVDATTGVITTVAGNSTAGFSGDGGPAANAAFYLPAGVVLDSAGNLFIADQYNHRIRRVDAATGTITTVAGNGNFGFAGDGGPATNAVLQYPAGVALDGAGNLFIADHDNQRIRRVDAATGVITTVAGNGTAAFSGDGGAATGASLNRPAGIAVDGAGNLFIADSLNWRIRRVAAATGTITTVAGDGNYGYGGDGGPATSASLREPSGVALDRVGNLAIADTFNARIRRVAGVAAVSVRLANISTRGQVMTGNDVMIGGFIIGGAAPKTVVVRARGPSLTPFGITNALANPKMDLYSGQTVIASNDDFGTSPNLAALNASGFAPSDALESAILTTLDPGPYTAVVSGVNNGTGVGIVEVFEVGGPEMPLANISTRGLVGTGNDVLIGGFIIQGDAPLPVVIRARGPSLAPSGIANPLADPVLQLFAGSTLIASNDDWQSSPNAGAIGAAGMSVPDPRESVIFVMLQPGAYTAIVSGKNGGTGVGIVEAFVTPCQPTDCVTITQ